MIVEAGTICPEREARNPRNKPHTTWCGKRDCASRNGMTTVPVPFGCALAWPPASFDYAVSV